MDEGKLRELWDIRSFFERKYNGYPFGHCGEAAALVSRVAGFKIRTGFFDISPFPKKTFSQITDAYWEHAWNYESLEDIVVDLSADQFPGVKSKILILLSESNYLERYVYDWYLQLQFAWERIINPTYRNNYVEYQAFSQSQKEKKAQVFA